MKNISAIISKDALFQGDLSVPNFRALVAEKKHASFQGECSEQNHLPS